MKVDQVDLSDIKELSLKMQRWLSSSWVGAFVQYGL
jgi:hypothetical protein